MTQNGSSVRFISRNHVLLLKYRRYLRKNRTLLSIRAKNDGNYKKGGSRSRF